MLYTAKKSNMYEWGKEYVTRDSKGFNAVTWWLSHCWAIYSVVQLGSAVQWSTRHNLFWMDFWRRKRNLWCVCLNSAVEVTFSTWVVGWKVCVWAGLCKKCLIDVNCRPPIQYILSHLLPVVPFLAEDNGTALAISAVTGSSVQGTTVSETLHVPEPFSIACYPLLQDGLALCACRHWPTHRGAAPSRELHYR